MKRTKYLSIDEVKQLRTVTEARAIVDAAAKPKRIGGTRSWMLVDIALSTGLRVSELAKIQIKDVDFNRRFIYVWRLKRKKPLKDELAISPELRRHLKEYINKRKKGYLFESKRYGKLSAQGLHCIWKAAIKRAGLPKELSIHSARHTMAVLLLAKTTNIKQVSKQLGHQSIETTAKMYADVSFDDMLKGVTGLYDFGKEKDE